MNVNNLFQPGLYIVVLIALAIPLGRYMTAVLDGSSVVVRRVGRPVETVLYKLAGVNPDAEMSWKHYALTVLAFNTFGVLVVYGFLRLQQWLPANPQGFGPMTPDAAFNTAVSFVTNTNWQDYTQESTVSYLTQMTALTVQNFLSAATGIAVVVALIRGFARHTAAKIGNFWVDLTRITLYILAPLATVIALVFISQGVIQNFESYKDVATVQVTTYRAPKTDAQGNPVKDAKGNPVMVDNKADKQTIAMGPAASQEAIKMLGTNGGGFFNGNSAHPYENPTPFANFVQMIAMLVIPAALCLVLGRMVGDRRQGYAVLAAMTIAFAIGCWGEISAEQSGNPLFTSLHVVQRVVAAAHLQQRD